MGYLDQAVQDIYLISADGGEVRQLTDDDTMNSNPIWSPDGREILYQVTMRPDIFNAMRPVLRVIDLDGHRRDVLDDWGHVKGANWTSDGQRIVFVGQPHGLTIGSKKDVYVIDRHGGVPENRAASLKFDPGSGLQSDMAASQLTDKIRVFCDHQQAWVRVQRGGTCAIYRVALDGAEDHAPVVSGERACYPLGVANGRLLYMASTLNDPTQLFVCDLDGRSEAQVTHLNGDFLADFALPQVEHLAFKGIDGVDVEGWYLRPPNGAAPYPTILYIHGGPHSAFGHVYSFDFQMLAGAGYGVLLVNHRASTGYGNAFSTAIRGDWGNLDYHDLMAGVDRAIALGLADADRLGVCGLSGGGYLSSWIVGRTDRFKAAIPENPLTSWLSFYGVSDIGVLYAVEQLGGHPHEIPDVYARCSPITHAHRCTTPTLLVQAEQDYRCPPEQSEQFYSVLKANACIVEMLRLPNSSHDGAIDGPVANRRAQNEAMLDWFQRYIPVSA